MAQLSDVTSRPDVLVATLDGSEVGRGRKWLDWTVCYDLPYKEHQKNVFSLFVALVCE